MIVKELPQELHFISPCCLFRAKSTKLLQIWWGTGVVQAKSKHTIVGTRSGNRNLVRPDLLLANSSWVTAGCRIAASDGAVNSSSIKLETTEVLTPEAAAMATAPNADLVCREPGLTSLLSRCWRLDNCLVTLSHFSAKIAAWALGLSLMLNILMTWWKGRTI